MSLQHTCVSYIISTRRQARRVDRRHGQIKEDKSVLRIECSERFPLIVYSSLKEERGGYEKRLEGIYLFGVWTSSTCLVKACFIGVAVDVEEVCSTNCQSYPWP
jgi:hypothetical protein